MQTVLITGCSSGFGLEIAQYFLARDWQVIATMRTPNPSVLPSSAHLRILALDVTNPDSIRNALEAAGPIDVLVNNAGIGAAAPAEAVQMSTVRDVFETNTMGTIALTQAVLPQFRQRRSGVVINVTSSVTLKPLPLLGAYRASKAAVNAFTESVAVEMEPFGVRARLVLPGRAPSTRFGDNAGDRLQGLDHAAYADLVKNFMTMVQDTSLPITHSKDVAEAVWYAATDPTAPVFIPAGADAEAWAAEAR